MKKEKILAVLSGTGFLLSYAGTAYGDPLTGNVQVRSMRVTRPGGSALSATVDARKPFDTMINDDSFKLEASQNKLEAQVEEAAAPAAAQTPVQTPVQAPVVMAVSKQPELRATVDRSAGTIGGGAGHATAAPVIDDYNAKRPLQGSVTFRFCYYDLGDGVECCWEGLRDANYLKGRGVDIAIMLDRGGVRLANKHNMHEEQLHRGSTEKMVKTQTLLRQFIDSGGTVYVSERWAKTFGLTGGSYPALTAGVKLVDDEAMADLLVERNGRIVEY